jgi:tetratricopeptide (TPR) repeat protein
MTKFCIRSLILLGGMVLIQPQCGFAQAPPATPPSAEVSAAQADIAKNPNAASPYIALSMVENNQNHPDEAIAAASHALAMPYTEASGAADLRPLAYYALARAYAIKGDTTNALSQADAGLSRYPGSPVLNDIKGMILIGIGQYFRASEVLLPAFAFATHTVDLKAFNAWGYAWDDADFVIGQNLVVSQYYAGQYPQALESARQLVALHDLGSVCVSPEIDPGIKKQCSDIEATYHNLRSIDGYDVSTLTSNSGYALKHYLKGPVGSVAEISVEVFSMGKFLLPGAEVATSTKLRKLKIVRQAVPLTKGDTTDFALLALTLNANGDREQALTMAQKAITLDPATSGLNFPMG